MLTAYLHFVRDAMNFDLLPALRYAEVFLKKNLELHIECSDAVFFWLQMGLNWLLMAKRGR